MSKMKLTRNRIFLAVLLLVLIIAIVIFALIKPRFFGEGEEGSAPSIDDIGLQAAVLAENDDPEEIMEYYDEQIEGRQNPEEKKILLVMKSRAAQGSQSWDVAIDAAKQADDMGSDSMTMRTLADAYAASGDKEQALALYRELLKKYPPDGTTPQRGPSLEDVIRGLEE